MVSSAPSTRRDFLRQTQNADGGWGYFPGKRSWLEPTLYATLALHGEAAAARGFRLIQSWALPQGGWRMSADVTDPNWTSALCLTVYVAQGVKDQAFDRGLHRVLRTVGSEGNFQMEVAQRVNPSLVDFDNHVQGWPWRNGNNSWVEPTVHSLVALKRVATLGTKPSNLLSLQARIQSGEKMLLDRQCEDGGWNYGNRRVWGVVLPSYPETTGVALLALQDRPVDSLKASLDIGRRYWRETASPFARAWLSISLRNFGFSEEALPANSAPPRPSQDILLAALQSLGEPGGNYRLLHTGRAA